MKKNYIYVILPVIAIILELLPWGAVLKFAGEQNADGTFEYIYHTEPYFSPLPFGFANFGPLLTAVLTCILLILGIIFVISKKDKILDSIKVVLGVAIATSLMPLIYGFDFFSIVGALISALLILEFVIVVVNKNRS